MTRLFEHVAALVAAVAIVVITWVPVVTMPAEPPALSSPMLV